MTMGGVDDEEHLPKPGDIVAGKYQIERIIGKGGMGAVLAAHHQLLGQRVAVKFLLGEIAANSEAVARFNNEARNAFKIQSEHVCRVMDVGTENGFPYMVMEYLEGGDLSQLLEQRGALPVEEAVDYVLQSLEAIAQAHALGIVHRDLKPANLFLAKRQDGGTVVKVLDFGIAKASNPFGEASGGHNLTSTKSMLGSPLYMSPEQLRSAKNVDARADVWALGVILYELLTGTVPFNGETLGELFIAILETQPVPVSQKRPDVPQALSEAIMRCLQRNIDYRFANVAELAVALASCAPARSYVSVERVAQSLGMPAPPVVMPGTSSDGVRAPMPSYAGMGTGSHQLPPPQMMSSSQSGPMPAVAGMPGSQTNAAWGQTGGGAIPKSKAPLFAGLAVGALVMLGVASVGVYKVTHHSAAAGPETTDPSASAAETATAAPTETTTTTAATATAAETATQASTATAPPTETATAKVETPPAHTNSTHTKTHHVTSGKGTPEVKTHPTATAATTTAAPTPTHTAKPAASYDPFGGR